ncbi:MAG: hypothetical protein FJX52_14760, partial [Alphaproteobacteria bacterium]|nr:hypothetical protein [Alphaproteobacteria bacterium]
MELVRNPVEELANKVFASRPSVADDPLDRELWDKFCASGLDLALCSGEPAALGDGVLALRAAGRAVARIPAAEAMLARWLAQQAGWLETGPFATVLTEAESWRRVPWGRAAKVVYLIHDGAIARHRGPFQMIGQSDNLAGEPRDTIAAPAEPPERSARAMPGIDLLARGALLKAAMMVGAMDETLRLCVIHAGQRVQFGRPIAQFQAVQQMLAQLATQSAAAGAAVDLAAAEASVITAAIAKARTSESVNAATDLAHQIMGAMGFTIEF